MSISGKQIPFSIAVNVKEFLAGIAAEEAAQNVVKRKAIEEVNKFVTTIDKDLREIYDKFVPNVHVLDTVHMTKLIAKKISENPEKFLDKGSDPGIAIRFSDINSIEYQGLFKVIHTAVKTYYDTLLTDQKITNPIEYLNQLSKDLFSRTRKIENTVSARVLGAEFGSRIRHVFGNKSNLAAYEPRLGSTDTTFVFFSASFNALSGPMRLKVYEPVKEYVRDTLGTDTRSKLDIGATINIGHAALVNELGSYVNSPAFASVLFGVAKGRSTILKAPQVQEAATAFKLESRILENSITVTKELTSSESGFGVLLSLGVTFTNTEDAESNQLRGTRYERPAVSKYKFSKPEPLSRSAITKLTNSIFNLVLKKNPILGKSSRSILEFLNDAFIGTISGNKTSSERTKTKVTSKTTKLIAVPTKSKATNLKLPAVSKPTTSLNKKSDKDSLAPLQALLDRRLALQIERNMGTGGSHNILNFRTGRLAESAKVERLSKSREGMITAFYTYMKNPYATFSEGGLQSLPKSRDPKLLISKSIRELGATMAYNRMRAVLV